MKTFSRILLAAVIVALATSCDAFRTLTESRLQTAQGRPYELIVVASQQAWTGEVGDSLRAIFTAPIPYLNQTEPQFDMMRVTERGFTGIIAAHRNILKVLIDPSIAQTSAAVQYNVNSEPQTVVTLQGPDNDALITYLAQHGQNILQIFEQSERDRAITNNQKFHEPVIEEAIQKTFGMEMNVPKGYMLAKQSADFIWARLEYPTASQGFFIYSYPYTGTEALSPEALLAARNKFAAQIPGPSDNSYMTTSEVFAPEYKMFRLNGRLWCEMRGFWDVAGDFMGGPYVSYTTIDTQTNRIITLDGYIFSPKLNKRNFLRGVEHLFYGVRFPQDAAMQQAAEATGQQTPTAKAAATATEQK